MITSEDIRNFSLNIGQYIKDRPLELIVNIILIIIIIYIIYKIIKKFNKVN